MATLPRTSRERQTLWPSELCIHQPEITGRRRHLIHKSLGWGGSQKCFSGGKKAITGPIRSGTTSPRQGYGPLDQFPPARRSPGGSQPPPGGLLGSAPPSAAPQPFYVMARTWRQGRRVSKSPTAKVISNTPKTCSAAPSPNPPTANTPSPRPKRGPAGTAAPATHRGGRGALKHAKKQPERSRRQRFSRTKWPQRAENAKPNPQCTAPRLRGRSVKTSGERRGKSALAKAFLLRSSPASALAGIRRSARRPSPKDARQRIRRDGSCRVPALAPQPPPHALSAGRVHRTGEGCDTAGGGAERGLVNPPC